ncbi:unnamed protein product [Adineta steineri]|uniref:E3 ubiquitin-protein ligase RNF216 UBA domain-containing protein n=1 Tax=Adineta steineri TaxID=433720 RepID=A0A815PVB5_9BILA|nr:unnamed protein product [Adineta steineri]CAF3976713.1 unnamed protein product [Adineta steineri]
MTDANVHPSVILVRDRLHDIFPDIKIPLEFIGWHIRQSTSIETICSNFVAEILSFGKVTDPTKDSNLIEKSSVTSTTTTASAAAAATTVITPSTITKDDVLQTLYDVFNSIPHDHIDNVYIRLKNSSNVNWYDDIVNELLSYNEVKPVTSKRSFDEINIEDEYHPEEYDRLLAILPDIDPDYALESYMKFLEQSPNKTDLNVLITNLIENGYVKLKDKLERLRNERLKENLREPKFEIEEFLKTFPNPSEYFYDRTKTVSESYKKHAYTYIANAFARVPSDYIKQVLNYNNYRFAPTMDQLQQEFKTYHVNQGKKSSDAVPKRLNNRARALIPIPDVPDEIFYKELCYTKHSEEIEGE